MYECMHIEIKYHDDLVFDLDVVLELWFIQGNRP